MEFGKQDSLIFAANTIPLPLTPNHFNNSKFGDNQNDPNRQWFTAYDKRDFLSWEQAVWY